MPAKPEGRYIAKVHNHLSNRVYHQGMGLTATNGTPDDWYEGPTATLWVEYKWWDNIPPTFNLCTRKSTPKLSKLQQRWLKRGHKNASNVAVVLGSPDGAIFLPDLEWMGDIMRDSHEPMSPADVANKIAKLCGVTHD